MPGPKNELGGSSTMLPFAPVASLGLNAPSWAPISVDAIAGSRLVNPVRFTSPESVRMTEECSSEMRIASRRLSEAGGFAAAPGGPPGGQFGGATGGVEIAG